MFKNTYIKILTFTTLFILIFSVNVFADEIEKIDDQGSNKIEKNEYREYSTFCYNKQVTELSEEQEKENLESANSTINELLVTLKDKVAKLDERVEYIRTTGEYDNYPAIRLNLDTPIFGLSSIIEQKLKISKDVSPNDIANAYSIRNIVKNNYIKLPDSYIAGILISTYEVDLKSEVELSNANIIILKLTQYINKVDEIEKFLDNQVSKFYRGYIEKEKLANISDVESRIARQNQELQNVSEIIIKIGLLDDKSEKYVEYFSKYIELLNKLVDLKDKVSDTLMDKDTLNEYKMKMINIESDVLNFTTKVRSSDVGYKDMSDEDVLTMLKNTKKNIEIIKQSIDKYIESSTYEKEVIISNDEESNENSDENLKENDESKTDNIISSTEQINLYDVTYESVINNLDNYLSEIDNMIKKIEEKITEENKNIENSDENEQSNLNVSTEEELSAKTEIITSMLKMYKEALTKENKFYLNNINNMLKNVTSKISDLSKYTESDIYDSVKYIYIDIPVILEEYMKKVDTSYISQISLNSSLTNELDKMIKTYINADVIYTKMQVDTIKQSD